MAMQPIRVLHLVSGEALLASMERAALRAVLSIPRAVVEPQVVRFARADEHAMPLRLLGVAVHDIGALRQPFSPLAFRELRIIAQSFRPQILHAWDYPAQSASLVLQKELEAPCVVWSMASTRPRGGLNDQTWLRAITRGTEHVQAIVYSSRVSATAHHEAGFPPAVRRIIEPGVDADLYKPDFAARRRVRAQLDIPADAFVVCMHAPFARHVDHAALIDAAAELADRHTQLRLLLGGTQVELQNAAFAALLRKARTLHGRVHVVGRTVDMEDVFNASDVACFTASNDSRRLDVAAAMLCGVPCVATDVDAQRELLGDCALAVAPGDVLALQAAMASLVSMSAAQRAAMAQRARQHILQSYTVRRTVSRYRRLYEKLLGGATVDAGEREDVETPQSDTP